MTERPLDCDPEQGGRQGRALLEWMEADAKITHVEGGEMGNMEREKALLDLRWDGLSFLFVSRGRVGIHLLPALPPFCARLEVFLAYLIVSPSVFVFPHLPLGMLYSFPLPFHSLPSPNGRQTVSR